MTPRPARDRLVLVPRRTFLLSLLGLWAAACGRRLARRAMLAATPTSPPPGSTAPTAGPPTVTTAPTSIHTAIAQATPIAVTSPTAPPITPTSIPSELAADTVLVGGKVITVDGRETIAQAIAIKDGLIQTVGDEAEVRTLVGERTRIIALQGRAVTPGMIDPHNHLQVAGMLGTFYAAMMPPEVRDVQGMRDKLAELVARIPKGEWIQAYFLALTEGRLPNRTDLDPVSPDHPVWVLQMGGHYGSANSMALRLAGIDASTPDPVGGVIERDAQGQPTGVFYNHRAMDMLRRVAPRQTVEQAKANIREAQKTFAALGVTSFQDNNVRGAEGIQAYLDVWREGGMLLRGSIYYTLEWPQDLERALHEIPHEQGDAWMRMAGFKFLLDGQAKMAYCHAPHTGVRWDLPTWEPQSFREAVRALHETGLQICVHCVGDAAVDLTLDAYEQAMNAKPRSDPRHRIEHCILCTPQAIQRMHALGVVVCAQPQFIRLAGNTYEPLFGAERAARVIVTREWLEGGVRLALGSDAPTTPWLNPGVALAAAVARPGPTQAPYHPEQKLTIQEALHAHTLGAAYAGHAEQQVGSLEVGKCADLVVWDQDPYTATEKQLWQLPVAMTIVAGKTVYEA